MKSGFSAAVPLSFAGAAALLSVVTGFISGVSPGSILIRGAAAGFLTALFVLSVRWIVKRYLPELTDLAGREGEEASSAPESGRNINIVMPEEPPGPQESAASSESPMSTGVYAETGDRDNKIAESPENVHNNKPEVSVESVGGPAGTGDLDILPSLDTLEISSGNSHHEDDEASETDSVSGVSEKTVDLGEHGDPSEIAKAVKTVLSRDQQK